MSPARADAQARVEARQRELDRLQLLDDVVRFGRAKAVFYEAVRRLRRLGHIPLNQGAELECCLCGRGGILEPGKGFEPAKITGSIDDVTPCPVGRKE